MKAKRKIVSLVMLQIMLIAASFIIIIHFESQTAFAGNAVNVAGKNRLLTSTVLVELHHALFYNQTHDTVKASLEDLYENIMLLKEGGQSPMDIRPLPDRFDADWNAIHEKFLLYEADILDIITQDSVQQLQIMQAEATGVELTRLSDILAENLSNEVDALSIQLILLQITLGLFNICVHIFMIALIWRIFNKYAEDEIKTTKLATIGEFATTMAHNLTNPLSAIQTSATRIRRHSDHPVIISETDRTDRCIARMSHQIEDVMNYTRISPPTLSEESVLDILQQSASMVEIPKNISLAMPESDVVIECDRTKLEVAFVNLLRNAVQAIKDVSGSITVRLEGKSEMVRIEFANSGPPIPDKYLQRIFEPLFTTKMRGTGLGLASCKNILDSHNGSITASNEPVTFTIDIPQRQ